LAFRRNGITDGVETISAVRPQEQCRVGGQALEGSQNTPKMIRLVIAADGEHGSITPNDAVRAFESLEFRALDIHFQKRDVFAG
jgi:hypothetical protein